jgi:Domain of unknown function (DU1801)
MAARKTKLSEASVADFLDAIPDAQAREDCWTITGIMRDAAKAEPKMWGRSIVGFGDHRYVNAGGKQVDWMTIGFSPRKQYLALYVNLEAGRYDELMSKLGKHSCGKGCLYVKRLSDIHLPTLKKLIGASARRRINGSAPSS